MSHEPDVRVTDRVSVVHLSTPRSWREQLEEDVRAGLTSEPRWLPPKYFYDDHGSRLFERITTLPEYYPTRTEAGILDRIAPEVMAGVRPDEVVELGSGSSRKTRRLLESMHAEGSGSRYLPIDVSEAALTDAATTLAADYPWLEVTGYVGDFHADVDAIPHDGRRLVIFLGSTIGNLDRSQRAGLLRDLRTLLGTDDRLLLGLDLVKSPDVLIAAYDDPTGVTAAFNRNILSVVGRGLDSPLPVEAFDHDARWNAGEERVEMWLVANRDVCLEFPPLSLEVPIARKEGIRTELSCKFRRDGIEAELAATGLEIERWDTDPAGRFAVAIICTAT